MVRTGLYPGAFDPFTLGHVDIVGRAVKLVDRLVIGITTNESKQPLFAVEERVEIAREAVRACCDGADIQVMPFQGLLMHFAEEIGASVIVRGLRAVSDFEYEFQMTAMNQRLNDRIETVFLMADPRHQAVASRLVKEIARLGGDVSPFVSPAVEQRLKEKYS